jgi:hypothetical protein
MKKLRRVVAGFLIVLGGLIWWLAPETPGGIIVLIVGVIVEIIGISLEHNKEKKNGD